MRTFPDWFEPYPETRAEEYRRNGYWTDDTVADFFATCVASFRDNEALVGQDLKQQPQRLTYQQLDEAAAAQATFLHEQVGIQAGQFVVVQLPNTVEFVVTTLALFKIGALPILVLPAHRRFELSSFIDATQARYLICASEHGGFNYRGLGEELQQEFPWLNVVYDARDLDAPTDPTATLARDRSFAPRDAYDPAFLLISGGTTGTPKLIVRTAADYLYSVRESATICGLTQDTRFFIGLPVSHNFSLSSPGVLGVFAAGGCVILEDSLSPLRAFDVIAAEGATMTNLVPPVALTWMSLAGAFGEKLASLTHVYVGGARFATEAATTIEAKLGVRLVQVFGMAEGHVSYTRGNDDETLRTTTQGRSISPADEIRIVPLDTEAPADTADTAEPGRVGAFTTRGPYTICGYFDHVDAESFTDEGFYCSGDVVRQLDSGHLIVEGRTKDQINRGGEKISAEEIENHLLAHEHIFDAAIVAVADRYMGEKSCAFLIPTQPVVSDQWSAFTRDLRAWLTERGVAEYKIPDEYRQISEFPATAVGKTNRRQLRDMLARSLRND